MEEGDIESPESLDTSFLDEIMKEEGKEYILIVPTNLFWSRQIRWNADKD